MKRHVGGLAGTGNVTLFSDVGADVPRGFLSTINGPNPLPDNFRVVARNPVFAMLRLVRAKYEIVDRLASLSNMVHTGGVARADAFFASPGPKFKNAMR